MITLPTDLDDSRLIVSYTSVVSFVPCEDCDSPYGVYGIHWNDRDQLVGLRQVCMACRPAAVERALEHSDEVSLVRVEVDEIPVPAVRAA